MLDTTKREKNKSLYTIPPYSPDFWRTYAQETNVGPLKKRCMKGECWDAAAATYDDLDNCKDYMHQVNSIIGELRSIGALTMENTVIDVACGTGTYAIRMAPYCKKVACLDISKGMLARLEEKRDKSGINNLEIIQADWKTYDPSERFDLVFVSLTPLLKDMKNLDRFLDISKKFLGLVCWAGIKDNLLFNSLYEEIIGHKPDKRHMDIQIPLNYLYTKGFAPNLKFFHGCWYRERDIERQAKTLIWQLELYRPLSQDEKTLVYNRLKQIAKDGKVTVNTKVRTGFILVDKHADDFTC